MTFARFFTVFFLISLLVGLFAYLFEQFDPTSSVLVPYFWFLFGFLALVTVIAFFLASKSLKKDSENSIYVIMGVSIAKLLLCMTLVLVYLLKVRVNGVFFALEFFSLYLLFTSFEVYALLCNLRHQNKM